jgi:hypothetical protein
MASRFRHEDREAVPKGWKVRTVKAGKHRVRVAFPPGRKVKGSGRLVSILHPLGENPCELRSANPAELMVMSANNPPRRGREYAVHVESWYGPAKSPEALQTYVRTAKTMAEARQIRAEEKEKARRSERKFKISIAPNYHSHASNPAELLVMGANPGTHLGDEDHYQVKLTSGTPLRFRTLDDAKKAIKPEFHHLIEFVKVGSQANPRVEVVSSPNPSTEEIVEEFTGRPVEYLDVYNEPHMKRGRYGKLGPLVALYVKPAKGGQVQRIGAPEAVGKGFPEYWNGTPPLIVTDSTAKQIYFVDGTQDISNCLHLFTGAAAREGGAQGIYELGQVRRIDYQCRKEVASPEEDLWKHDHGEENGVLPTLLFDAKNKRLLYEGGDYRIEGPWIHN